MSGSRPSSSSSAISLLPPSDGDLGVEEVNTQTLARASGSQSGSQTQTSTTTRKRKSLPGGEEEEEEEGGGGGGGGGGEPKKKKGRKKATEKGKGSGSKREWEEEMVLPVARTVGGKMLVGAHVSMAKGVQNAVSNTLRIGGNAFALFLKSQRKWSSPAMKAADVTAFRSACRAAGFDPKRHILPHGSYLVNLAAEDDGKAQKAYSCFLDDLKRCELLGIGLYNFHPGSTLGLPRAEALTRVATMLNRAHKETKFCRTVLENMAGHGNVIGGDFEDLRDIISQVEDKSRMGAAGHDIRTQTSYAKVLSSFDRLVGLDYLVALHLNDSKAPLGAHRDLHQNIGLGYLGLEPFRIIMNDDRLAGLPLILETPMEEELTWAREIKLLESLVGVGPHDKTFLEMKDCLAKEGKAERDRVGAVTERKRVEKETKKEKKKKGGKKKKKEESEDDDEDEDSDDEHEC